MPGRAVCLVPRRFFEKQLPCLRFGVGKRGVLDMSDRVWTLSGFASQWIMKLTFKTTFVFTSSCNSHICSFILIGNPQNHGFYNAKRAQWLGYLGWFGGTPMTRGKPPYARPQRSPLPDRSSTLPRCWMHHWPSCTCRLKILGGCRILYKFSVVSQNGNGRSPSHHGFQYPK